MLVEAGDLIRQLKQSTVLLKIAEDTIDALVKHLAASMARVAELERAQQERMYVRR